MTASAARPRRTTRLFYDAFGKQAWQQKGFYSVLDAQGSQAALMARMLELGHNAPLQPNAKLPDEIVLGLNRENMCATPGEFNAYAGAHPQGRHAVGGHRPDRSADTRPCNAGWPPARRLTSRAWRRVPRKPCRCEQWENLLNQPGAEKAWVALGLFEALVFLRASISSGEPGHTPVGAFAHAEWPTYRPDRHPPPNDDPGTRVYYRLWPVQGVIVRKNPHHLPAERGEDGAESRPCSTTATGRSRAAGLRAGTPGQSVYDFRSHPGAGALSVHAR